MKSNLEIYNQYRLIDGPLKVRKIQVYHGANYFSGGPIILFRMDLGEYDEVFTNQIEGFSDNLIKIIPSLYQHHCSVGKPGGFLKRLKEGTLLGHVTEHIAIELQTLAGMDVAYGKTRSTLEQGVYNVIFRYFDEIAGVYAGKAAFNLVNFILLNKPFNVFEVIESLINIRELRMFGPSTQAIIDEAKIRGIPYFRMDAFNLVQLGTGKYHKNIRATITSDTNLIAVETADNNYLSNRMLNEAGIQVPETIKTDNVEEIISFQKRIDNSIVIKPVEGYLRKNTTINIETPEDIIEAFQYTQECDEYVVAQQYVKDNFFRLLVIDNKFIAAGRLEPPKITGNGGKTINELIEELNSNPEREFGDKGKLSKVEIDAETERILNKKGYELNSVLPKGENLFLKNSGNPKKGGFSTDVTDEVHSFNIFIAERAAKIIGLNVAGIDIITKEINKPITDQGGVVVEVNAAPDFRMHINPAMGESRNVAAPLLDMLFPAGAKTRVPLISITGTVGKTITAHFLDYCLKKEGYKTGLTTSNGIYIGGKCLKKGNMTFPEHAQLVLKDPTIDCAIVETSCEGILQKGLGYEYADVGIFLNIGEEHIGENDIRYIEDLAYAKSVVAEQVYEDGFSVLNADDPLVLDTEKRLFSQPVLFSKQADNKAVTKYMNEGGQTVFIKDNKLVISKSGKTQDLISLQEVALFDENNVENKPDIILATVSTLLAFGISTDNIRQYLSEFSIKSFFGLK